MPWLKIDDELFLHPKWLVTPVPARALWITALSYCGKFCNGGLIHPNLLPALGGTVEDAEALVASGLWERDGDAYRIHEFDAYNSSSMPGRRESVSEARAEAGRAGGQASGMKRRAEQGRQDAQTDKQDAEPGKQDEATAKQIEANRSNAEANRSKSKLPGPGTGTQREIHPQTPTQPGSVAEPGGGGDASEEREQPDDPDELYPTVDRRPQEADAPWEKALPLAVAEALHGCPAHWEPALRALWRRNADRIGFPTSWLCSRVDAWKRGENPPQEPPPPAPSAEELEARRAAGEERRRIQEQATAASIAAIRDRVRPSGAVVQARPAGGAQ
jgi:hypothetical protein